MDTCCVTFVAPGPAGSLVRWLPWLSLLSVLASGCLSGPPTAVQIQTGGPTALCEQDSLAPPSLKVTTFNVWGLPSWLNGASPDRYGKIAHELTQLGSDVVLLQEVWTRRCFDALSEQAKGAGRTWWAASARRKHGLLGQNGLLTLSRFPVVGAVFRRFSSARLPDSLMNKGALKVTLAIRPGQRVNIWNVHLQDEASGGVRSRQMAELVRWVKEAEDGQVADIVGGDLNFTPASGEFQQFVAAIGPSVHQLANAVELPTWDGLKLSPQAAPALDHIFVRMRQPADELRARPRRIFTASRREDRLSDHMGVEALVTFRAAEESGAAILGLRTASSALPVTSALTRR